MSEKEQATRFLRVFWLTLAGMFLVVGIFNGAVDPFGMLGSPRIAGFNEVKPEIGTHVRMAKAYQVRPFNPGGVILGTSRADVGLDPEHKGWARDAAPVYNLALSSGRIDEIYGYLRHAQAHGPLKQVVLSLDLMMFNANWRKEADYSESRLSIPEKNILDVGWVKDLLLALFSLDGLKSSQATIEAQSNPTVTNYFPNGARDTSRKWAYVQAKGGHFKLFLMNTKNDLVSPAGWSGFALEAADGSPPPIDTLRNIVRFCKENDIDLRVIISPIHASKMEVLWSLGLGATMEQWKRQVTKILASADVPLWDFSGYNSITTEPFPPLGDATTQMKNYWEGSHYKKHIGALILDRVFGITEPGVKIPDDFGVRLTPENIDQVLQVIREDHMAYRKTHSRDITAVEKLVRETSPLRRQLVASRSHGPVGE